MRACNKHGKMLVYIVEMCYGVKSILKVELTLVKLLIKFFSLFKDATHGGVVWTHNLQVMSTP